MSKSDDLRKRLEALNRKPLADKPPAKGNPELEGLRSRLRKSKRAKESAAADKTRSPAAGAPSADAPAVRHGALPASTAPGGAKRPLFGTESRIELEQGVAGTVVKTPSGGELFVVERRPGKEGQAYAKLDESLRNALARDDTHLSAELERADIEADVTPDSLVFFDLETTGLGSSPLFLIGAMVAGDEGLVVKQYFARDYTEERAVVETFLTLCADKRLLVSFNGKSFDVPFVRMRAAYNGLTCDLSHPHLDLLHASRRIWKGTLPDCKLQTLESHICGRWRTGDIPGSMIPDAYHDFVRTSNAARMIRVLEHNYLDLVTLAEIMVRMPVKD